VDEIRALAWSTDPEAYQPVFAQYSPTNESLAE
jgi:hypothetical protein